MDLENQVKEHQDFLEHIGLGRGIPMISRYHLGDGPGALTALATRIRADAHKVQEAKKLVNIPRGAGIVFDLVRQLGNYSYGDLDYDVPARYGDRPSDEIVDTMMQGLALPRYHEDPDWDFSSVLKALKRTAEYLEEFGIKDYCVQTIAELACWESTSLADTTSEMDVDG